MLVIGIDAATWKVIKPNLDRLTHFNELMDSGEFGSIELSIKPLSAISWCSMFSGKLPEEHNHTNFVENGKLKKREDIPVDFVWDTLSEKGYQVKVLNVPFVVPPFNFNCDFKPVGHGLPTKEEEWEEELERVTEKAKEILSNPPDLFIMAYTLLDRIQHFHWGETVVTDWYQRVDEKLGELIPYEEKILVCSDHGMADFDEATVQTLPRETKSGRKLRGDHSTTSMYIKKNVKATPKSIPDISNVILGEFE